MTVTGISNAGRICLAVAGVLYDGTVPDNADDGESEAALAPDFSRPALRYFGLTAHYRAPWNFSPTGIAGAECAHETLLTHARRLVERLRSPDDGQDVSATSLSEAAQALQRQFLELLANDLDTPGALALLWQALHSNLPLAERRALLLDFDQLLQLDLAAALTPPTEALPAGAHELIELRAAARHEKDWARSDELRGQLASMNVETQDTPQGSVYRRLAPSSGTGPG